MKMKKLKFLSKIKEIIIKIVYSVFRPTEKSLWQKAIERSESFEYQFSFGNYVCFMSITLDMIAIYNPLSGLVVLCVSNYMVGPSNRFYSKHLGTLLKKIEIKEFSFPIIPPNTMLFSTTREEDNKAIKESDKSHLDESSKKFAIEFYEKNFGFIPENIEPDILYFYTSGYKDGQKEILENYMKLPFIKVKNCDKS